MVDIALVLQLRLGLGVRACWEVERRRMVPKADLLEAVMGLRDMYPNGWNSWGDMVDALCTVAYEAWPHRRPRVFGVSTAVPFKPSLYILNLQLFVHGTNTMLNPRRG